MRIPFSFCSSEKSSSSSFSMYSLCDILFMDLSAPDGKMIFAVSFGLLL